ncbi:MAG: acyltransferase family protein [Vicinamibacterales bacterium]
MSISTDVRRSVGIRTDIQGVRALAVLAVIANHAFPSVVTGGYVGVDIFFVISGYLISGIIVRDIEAKRFTIAGFYRRRARRILPALTVVLAVTGLLGFLTLPPRAFAEVASTTISTALFVSNVHFSRLTGYFDGAAEVKPLLHMWSLAVEEQFYLLFPLLLVGIWTPGHRRRSRAALWALWGGSVILMETWQPSVPAAAYYLLPTRAFELLLGVLFGVGAVRPLPAGASRHAASLLGLAMMCAAIVWFTAATPFPGYLALVPCVGAALLLHAGDGQTDTLGGRVLSHPALVYVGAISYSLYLWHWPILAYTRELTSLDLAPAVALGAVAVSLGLASLSYRHVEQPFLSAWGEGLPYLKLAGLQTATIVLCGSAILVAGGLPQRFSSISIQLFAADMDINKERRRCHNTDSPTFLPYDRTCVFGAPNAVADLAIWGDSHGAELAVYLGERAAERGRAVRELTSSACPPALGFNVRLHVLPCGAVGDAYAHALSTDASIRTVVLTANSVTYDDKPRLIDGIRQSVDTLLAAGKQVILVQQIPVLPFDPPAQAGIFARYGRRYTDLGRLESDVLADSAAFDRFVASQAQRDGVQVYDPKPALCRASRCAAVGEDGALLYFNGEHLSVTGARYAFKAMADAVYDGGGVH